MPRATVNYALAATLIAQGVTLGEIAEQVGAKDANSLRVGLARKGVTVNKCKVLPGATDRSTPVTLRLASQASDILRNRLSTHLDRHMEAMGKVPARADLKHLKQVCEVLEPLARTAKIVHDWGNETKLGLVALGVVEQIDQAQDALEVESSVCHTPIASVPEPPSS